MTTTDTRTLSIAPRPYVIDFGTPHGRYPLTSEDVVRLVANYPTVKVRPNRLTLRADNGRNTDIYPATLGGGASFTTEAQR